jgi:hypothetical protein
VCGASTRLDADGLSNLPDPPRGEQAPRSTAMHPVVKAMFVLALCGATAGCVIHGDGDESVSRTFGSDYFGAGGMLTLTETVAGDAIIAAGQIATAGEVGGDLIAAGGEVSVGGSIGDDLYVAGGEVRVDAIVTGNARLAGGDVSVGPATVVAGALSLTGGRIVFEGNTHSYLQAKGASVRIDGAVHGDAEVESGEIDIGPETRIAGKLIVRGPTEPSIPEGAEILGGLEFHEEDAGRYFRGDGAGDELHSVAHRVGSFLWVAGVFLVGTLFTLLLPGYSGRAADFIGREPLKSLGLGFVVLVCVPVLIVLLLITIVGIPLALILLPGYLALLFLGWVTSALFLGRKGLALLRSSPVTSTAARLGALLLAVLALWLLAQVPLIGGWIQFAALLLGIGALVWQVGPRREPPAPRTAG